MADKWNKMYKHIAMSWNQHYYPVA